MDHTVRGCAAAIISDPNSSGEIFAISAAGPKKLTHHNDAAFAPLDLGHVEGVEFKSSDGVTDVHGVLTYPVGYEKGKKYPMLLLIHGGPNGQDAYSFSFQNQFFAANGYAVLNVNYRGSNGRGTAYQSAIFSDWGHHEVEDLLGGVDHVVKMGVADPDKLGIGGWSYGGILTDYTTASDTRFKGAVAGAGSALQLTMYGTDQYTYQYDNEIGQPWKNPEKWIKISYPFFHADRIVTPTMYMGGQIDFNVPIAGGEQMYQALKSVGKVPTQLVIYPGEFHGIQRASFQRDRMERWLGWFDKYVKGITPKEPSVGSAGGREK
jgi:dipeptidyl aminopeptidase/acylaminoacyl peptidase